MARKHSGRHRAPGFNPLNELADIAAVSAQPALKASAVVVASGGLLASFALPASAAPGDTGSSQAAAQRGQVTTVATVTRAVAVAAPARATNAPTFGVIGFTGKATAAAAPAMTIRKIIKAAPPAAPVAAVTVRASRTTVRTAVPAAAPRATRSTTVAAPRPAAAPAPRVVALPAVTGGIIAAAQAYSGIPYVWGGTSTSGADCSGYTGLVFRAVGKSLSRTAEAQRQAATPVSNPVPGDLVFFGFPAYHVGIYAGGGMLYDAQRPGTVSGLHSLWTTTGVSYGRV